MEFIKLFCLVLCYNFVLCQLENTCRVRNGGTGICILYTQCNSHMELVSRSKIEVKSMFIPRRYLCPFPKLCCPISGIYSAPPKRESVIPIVVEEKSVKKSRNARNMDDENFATTLPHPPACGMAPGSLGRIANGVDANLGDFPWMAVLGYKNSTGTRYRWWCGGSLITSKHVLTAAHCIANLENQLQLVRLGELDLSRDDDGASPIDVPIKTKIAHQEFSSFSSENDIGILVLQEIVQFTDYISPICLPTETMKSESFEKSIAIIAGWGALGYQQIHATRLQKAFVPILNNDECAQAMMTFPQKVVDERIMCAKDDKGQDACNGDSGGPLMLPLMDDTTPVFYQIGIVSYGVVRCGQDYPGAYTRITHFLPWIEDIIGGSKSVVVV